MRLSCETCDYKLFDRTKIANKRGKPSKTINCIRYVLYTGNPLIYLYGTTSHWIEHTQKYYSIWNSFIVLNCCRQHCAFVVDVVVVDANDDIVIVYSFHTWFVYPFHLFLSPWALSSSLWPPGLPFSWSFLFVRHINFASSHVGDILQILNYYFSMNIRPISYLVLYGCRWRSLRLLPITTITRMCKHSQYIRMYSVRKDAVSIWIGYSI